MTEELKDLIERARSQKVTAADRSKQRLNFAFGNGAEEGPIVSKQSLKEADQLVRSQRGPNIK